MAQVFQAFVSLIVMLFCGVVIQVAMNEFFGLPFLRKHRIAESLIVGLSCALIGMMMLNAFKGCAH